MVSDIRKQAEVLFRRGNPRVSGGSEGTAWERPLDQVVTMLEDGEQLVYVAGFQNVGLKGMPATLITLTSRRLIFQLYPDDSPELVPLGLFSDASVRREFLQNYVYLRHSTGAEIKLFMPKDVAAPLVEAITAAQAGKTQDAARGAPGAAERGRPTRAELEALFARDNQGANEIAGAENLYFDRLERELELGETVTALISFTDGYRNYKGHTQFRGALLVVTSRRVLHMAGKVRFMSSMMSSRDQAGDADRIEVASIPYSELAGVTGRKTILGLGTERELYLDQKNGRFIKIRGMTPQQSHLAEERIRGALVHY